MATHAATLAILQSLKTRLDVALAPLFEEPPVTTVLNDTLLRAGPAGVQPGLALYLHRISIDPVGRNRYLPPETGRRVPRPELPVNLHLLLMAWSASADHEAAALTAAMQVIASTLELDSGDIGAADPGWGSDEVVQVLPEDMSTEDLMRLWEGLPGDYRLSVPYLVKTVRLAPLVDRSEGPPVRTRVFGAGLVPARN